MVYGYYYRLGFLQKRVYRRSDSVATVPLPDAAGLLPRTAAVGLALSTGDPRVTALACQALLVGLCHQLGVPAPGVTVLTGRPAGHWGELHGLYTPRQGPEGTITVWMRTARRGQVVAARTFLRTLLHELCHHLDFALLGLRHSFHTRGFYQREASLYRQLLPGLPARQLKAPARRPPAAVPDQKSLSP